MDERRVQGCRTWFPKRRHVAEKLFIFFFMGWARIDSVGRACPQRSVRSNKFLPGTRCDDQCLPCSHSPCLRPREMSISVIKIRPSVARSLSTYTADYDIEVLSQ